MRRGWVWFFGVLAILGATAVTIEIWYNLHQQLQPEHLASAQARWRSSGPADYDLEYVVRRAPRQPDLLAAVVDGDRLQEVSCNGRKLDPRLYPFFEVADLLADAKGPPFLAQDLLPVRFLIEVRERRVVRATRQDRPLDRRLQEFHDMDGLFAAVGAYLEEDRAERRSPFTVATFDRTDGHLVHYVRSTRRPRERIEVIVTSFRTLRRAAVINLPTRSVSEGTTRPRSRFGLVTLLLPFA